MSLTTKAMMITWAGLGIVIERENETEDALEIRISVPEHSCINNSSGEEMAGGNLAARFKDVLVEIGVKRLVVKYRVRSGEYWSDDMKKDAEMNMRKSIFRSQY